MSALALLAALDDALPDATRHSARQLCRATLATLAALDTLAR